MKKSLLLMVLVLMLSCAKGKNDSVSSNVEENNSNNETVATASGETAQVVEDSKPAEDSQKKTLIAGFDNSRRKAGSRGRGKSAVKQERDTRIIRRGRRG